VLDLLEQAVERQGHEDKGRLVHEVGDNPEADQTAVGNKVSRSGGGVAWHVHLGVHECLGEGPEEADQQVQDASGSG